MTDETDRVEFDDLIALALAESAAAGVLGDAVPGAGVRQSLMRRIQADTVTPLLDAARSGPEPVEGPAGFSFASSRNDEWMPHPVPGIRMKVLALNRARGYATLLLDVAPGTHFPPHHHGGAEECYVVSGSLFTCGRRLEAGDFVHADAHTDHGELWTEEGCRVILVVPPEEHLPASMLGASQPPGAP
jgi:quercetin dioxygenase-like cupin family protein